VDGKLLIVFDDLPLIDKRGLIVTEIDLIFHAIRGVNDSFEGDVDDLPGVQMPGALQ